MNWEEKLDALNSLSNCTLEMQSVGTWGVHQDIMVGNGTGTCESVFGVGETPEYAVLDHWKQAVENVSEHKYIAAQQGEGGKNKHYRWDKFMWKEVR